ncbi:MAG: PKD domain-containing protein [Acidobacteria bacterium]|nr:PKD domain-containing protein [Acidobacteriota bacterium]MBW4044105.1 PKD domain-containing protein [Acidobacteriota bacterium]
MEELVVCQIEIFLRKCAIAAAFAGALSLHAQNRALHVSVAADGKYSIGLPQSTASALTAGVAAQVDGQWLHSADYPRHTIKQSTTHGYLGQAEEWQVTWAGLSGQPDLICSLRAYANEPFADVQVTVHNSTGKPIRVQAIRPLEASSGSIAELGGPASADRVLSDSFSEDRPAMKIHDLADATGNMHRAVGSQLIYNRQSHQSLFVGALTSDRFLTILRLRVDKSSPSTPHVAAYEAESTGTTELEKENSLRHSPVNDQIQLSLPVAPGGDLSSEQLAISISTDYHQQLETYGSLIRQLHHARVAAPPLLGWWSWTAYYFGLNQGAALTNAEWEAQHLKQYGYNVFHIDEGYQYARGEYITPDATLFPHGLVPLEYQVRGLGLTPGIWTAPFEVSERSSIYQQHPDWLVKNAQGQPIHAGSVSGGKDKLYVLDTTHPGAQSYLRETYSKLVREWGLHYIKMDFMDDSAIEGYYYKPNTTAMEAQRIGLQIIRDTIGNDVYLDKDGSVMLNPVGYVDYGRISQDTGHTFGASHDAATGIAARYYMNRNFFVADPDAFAVSTQTITDQSWHESRRPATLDEAKVSIALAAVSGGMLEIGDDLPSLQNAPDRLALIDNRDLIDMIRLGRASTPIDLMSYAPPNEQPSIFDLKESYRQSILTVFNWTEHSAEDVIQLSSLGLSPSASYAISSVLENSKPVHPLAGTLHLTLPAHSVILLKIIDQGKPVQALVVTADHPSHGAPGEDLTFSAHQTGGDPVLAYRWNFGDGTNVEAATTTHAWTEPGDYRVSLTATGLSHNHAGQSFTVHITGHISTGFAPARNRRFQQP